jgi:hypothetical protein
MHVRIEGFALPGRSCEPADAGRRYENIHVGIQQKRDVVELVAGDADSATWSFEVTTRVDNSGATDFGGAFVQGRRGERFMYLSWGTVDDSNGFTMFRRAKLLFADVDPELVRDAIDRRGTLVGRLGLTDRCGHPRCARVRPPDIEWIWAPR